MTKPTSDWDKFRLLLWKNWVLQWNHKISLCLELFIPVIFALLLVLVRTLVVPEDEGITKYPPISINNLSLMSTDASSSQKIKFELAYSPENPLLDKLVKTAANDLKIHRLPMLPNLWSVNTSAHKNSDELELYLKQNNILSGVQFQDHLVNITEYPKHLDFALRFPSELRSSSQYTFIFNWLTNQLFPTFELPGPRNKDDVDGGIPSGYIREGFLPIQNAISRAFIKEASTEKITKLPEIVVQRYPYPEYLNDPLLQGLETMVSMIILLSYIYPVSYTIKSITLEKEKQLKEVMKIMGLKNWIHWAAWFVKGFVMIGFSATCIVTLCKIQWSHGVAVFTYSDWSVIWFFMLIYTTVTMFFCFMFATLFSRASTAAAVSGLLWFIFYIPFLFTENIYETLTLGSKLGLGLLSNTGMAFGMKLILQFEGKAEGLQWHNLFTPVSVDDTLTVGHIIIIMLVSSVMYLLICLYVEQIFPGDFGIPQKWYFPFTAKFWCGEPDYKRVMDSSSDRKKSVSGFEPEPNNKKVGLQINSLKKVFDKNKVAVNGVSMNMYEDEITVLLGHNGAGKTTTISMLTGMFPPTSGTAIVNGHDIRTNITSARQSMGFCPQHNVLFDDMSVRQHIIFFSRLKGVKGKEIDEEVEKYVKILQLENKMNVAAKKLSGGMKRKLSVGTALCGGTKVVLCDEPSSGMDPAARRQLWDLLQAEKNGRTILLTTHFMDEADVLGDRIAIMCDSELKCYGTSFFLKKRFGSGYILICVKKESCKSEDVTSLLQKYINGLKIESEIGAELTYNLPDEFSMNFEEMLTELDSRSDELGLNGYGISITSLEEVFMKVGAETNSPNHEEDEIVDTRTNNMITDVESVESDNPFSSDQARLLKGNNLLVNQWTAMFFKKYLYTIRNLPMLIIQIIMPIYFVFITIEVARTQATFRELKPLDINLKDYGDLSMTLMERVNISEEPDLMKISKEYESYVKQQTSSSNFEELSVGFEDYILNLYKSILVRVNTKYIAAATFYPQNITAWLNNQPLHTAPLTVNIIHNAMARAYLGSDYHISVTNSPLPYRPDSKFFQLLIGNSLGTQLSSNTCFCMCFVSSMYILFMIKERVSRSKLLQFVGGVKVWTFWLTQIIWDYFTYLVTALVFVGTIACFQEENFSTFSELGKYYLLLMIFGISVLPFTYLMANFFTEPAIGFGRISILNLFAGNALYIVIMVMKMPFLNTSEVAKALQWVFNIFPHYALASSMSKLSNNIATRKVCEEVCSLIPFKCDAEFLCKTMDRKECCLEPYFGWHEPGVLPEILYMLVCFAVLFSIVILYDFKIVFSNKKKPPQAAEEGYYDDDVENEKRRITEMNKEERERTNLVLDEVSKYYGKYLAVNSISLGVKHTECFGLLGVNGAGKTSTFKMMTGDENITSGNAYVKGINLRTNMNQVYKEIGYCPQFDALLDDLTGRETLKIFCLLRGIPSSKIHAIIEELSRAFGFKKHLDKRTKAYSGGNKRKLSTSIALIGGPSVVYLDEPTTGMDPAARRQLWNVICRIRDCGKSIVLTSHSMEECEALCTRLAIMVNGEFKCIGSTQHLKNKFSKGLILKIKIRKDTEPYRSVEEKPNSSTQMSTRNSIIEGDIEKLTAFINREFPEAVLKEHYQGILTYYIPLSSVKWSKIFGMMEKNRDSLNIEDYSISQTTLEQIFLEFAKFQREDPREIK
ncbi:ABCA3.2 family protein [Megaselia abdita]